MPVWGLEYACLGAILLLAALVRTIAISSQPLWGDEGLTLVIAEWPSSTLLFGPVDATGGIYYLLHKTLIPAGASIASIRGISVAAGILSVAVIYVIGRHCLNRRAALFSAALLALSPPLVDYSQEARSYSVLVLLVLVSALGLSGWLRQAKSDDPPVGWLGLFTIATLLAFYTHLTAVFWILPAVLGGLLLTWRRGSRTSLRYYVLAAVLMAILALPELGRQLIYAASRKGFTWLEQADGWTAVRTIATTFLPSATWRLAGEPARTWISIVAALSVFALIAASLIGHRRRLRSWSSANPGAMLVMVSLVSAPLWIWLFGFVVRPIFMTRTILIAVPGFILLIALAVQLARAWGAAALLLGFYAAALLIDGTMRRREEWDLVSQSLVANVRPGDSVILCPAWEYPAFRHALASPVPAPLLLAGTESMRVIEPRLGSSDRYIRNFFEIRYASQGWSAEEAFVESRRFWVITSDCRPELKSAIERWLGAGRRTYVAHNQKSPNQPRIRIWKFEGDPTARRPVTLLLRR